MGPVPERHALQQGERQELRRLRARAAKAGYRSDRASVALRRRA